MIVTRGTRPSLRFAMRTGLLFALFCMMTLAGSAFAVSPRTIEGPVGPVLLPQKAARVVPAIAADYTDIDRALAEDVEREQQGLPPRFALAEEVAITPDGAGEWIDLGEGYLLWRLRIEAPGAVSVNLAFSDYRLPKGARLSLYPVEWLGLDDLRGVRVFDEADNRDDGTLWTPLVQSDEVMLELLMPAAKMDDYELTLAAINSGYRTFGREVAEKQGSCNIDVVCSVGDDWWNEINSVGVYTLGGVWYCTGALINNTAADGTPYFLTADHCNISSSNDETVVVYWNYQSANCGDLSGGSLDDFTTGTVFLADQASSDVTLVLLAETPPVDFGVTFSGWDRSGAVPGAAVAIHHPACEEKMISFEDDPLSITSYFGDTSPGDETHLRVADWDLGTTEGGSSGSPLYDESHRIVGQLHGGLAACGNDDPDWYGRLSASWPVLDEYLDPLGTGALTLDGYLPNAVGITVNPASGVVAAGETGGPFDPDSFIFTITNNENSAIDYSAGADVGWLTVLAGGGTVPGSGTAEVQVLVNSQADLLAPGEYWGAIDFANLTDGEGDTSRTVQLIVGAAMTTINFPLDSDPGWSGDGLWAFGQPTGEGGEHGSVDPTSGYTGSNVLGYNMAGDYENDLQAQHLTSAPVDCSAMTGVVVRFQRWLGVEQPRYDEASFSVSADGVNWTTVWENDAEVDDGEWTLVEYDISAVADGQSAVQLRWTIGPTDDSYQYCGWNIDDIEFHGAVTYISAVPETPRANVQLACSPNPFNPSTTIRLEMAQAGEARLAVYNVQGRLVRSLHEGMLPAGPSAFAWDGCDDTGNGLGSGIYFAWLRSGDGDVCQKMVLLK